MKKYSYRVGIAIDQLANTIIGGYPNETLSARAWRRGRVEGDETWSGVQVVIDRLFYFDPRHCEESYLHTKVVTKDSNHYLPLYCGCSYIDEEDPLPIDHMDHRDFDR